MKIPVNTKRDIARELARRYSTMTHDELDVLESILVPMKFAKGEMILREGETCRNIYYLDHGLIRQFYFRNDKELTEHIGCDHSIFMCIESLFREEPTRLQVEALEQSIVWALPKLGTRGTPQRQHTDDVSKNTRRKSDYIPGARRLGEIRDSPEPLSPHVQAPSASSAPRAARLHRKLSADDARDPQPSARSNALRLIPCIGQGG